METGPTAWLVTVHEGRVTGLERGPFLMRAWSFAIRASEDAWRRFWEPVPAAGWHDLFALTKGGHATVEGDARWPEIDWSQWREASREFHAGSPDYSFVRYERAGARRRG